MTRVLTGISEIYTPFKRIERPALIVDAGRIAWVGPAADLPERFRGGLTEDLGGCGVLPGLVDCHTHLIWAGDRLHEYRQRARGESYEAILGAGGGIHNTVAATQAATEEELLALAAGRARTLLRAGVTTVEVKSGYGLLPEHELRMLRVARRLAQHTPQHVVPTLLAHVVPLGARREAYVERFVHELMPEVAHSGLAEAVDVFCDRGGFRLDETRSILEAAQGLGLKVKVHAEQLEHTGATRLAGSLGALSADHLEQSTPDDWRALARAGTVGTILPGAAIILRKPFPNARAMWDAGVKVAVATDHNPGSSPVYSLFLAMQLAVALGGLSVEEALVAGTSHAADALARPDLGRLAPGALADFLVVDSPHALEPLYRWGDVPLRAVCIGGERVWDAAASSV
jgi:imidazolonepropionase